MATLDGVTKSYGRRVVHDGLTFTIRRGERWCVMGKNGAGKTTLLKMVAGVLAPDAGTVRLGASLKLGYFAQQSLDLLDPDLTVWEQIQKDFPRESVGALRSLLGAFQFSGDDVEKKVRALSGGEKSRLVMARMLLDPPNFLVLDEPTNHLDLATKEMLVEALRDFEGTMLFVSHDRTFLRGLSNRVLELGGRDGHRAGAASLSGLVRRIRGAHRPRGPRRPRLSPRKPLARTVDNPGKQAQAGVSFVLATVFDVPFLTSLSSPRPRSAQACPGAAEGHCWTRRRTHARNRCSESASSSSRTTRIA